MSKPIEIRCVKCGKKACESKNKWVSLSVVCARCRTPYTYVDGKYESKLK